MSVAGIPSANELAKTVVDQLVTSGNAEISEACRDFAAAYVEAHVTDDRAKTTAWFRANVEALAKLMHWDVSLCTSCSAKVYWATLPSGRSAPIDVNGRPHFSSCPNADKHRRERSKR